MESGQRLMVRYGGAYIFLYRYPKGMRTIGALPIGLGQMDWPKFTVLNGASAALWTGTLVGVGYLFGAQVERAVEAGWGAASVALLVAFAVVVTIAWWRLDRARVVLRGNEAGAGGRLTQQKSIVSLQGGRGHCATVPEVCSANARGRSRMDQSSAGCTACPDKQQ